MIRDLTKWPRLVVVGESITREQAAEVILRTNDWSFTRSHNDAWDMLIWDAVGLPYDITFDNNGHPHMRKNFSTVEFIEAVRRICADIETIKLMYLHTARVATPWIGGRHGWCNWNGQVLCGNHNIGKWPSHEYVLEDWRWIASAFPFLNLRAQLWADEGAEDENGDPDVIVEYVVKHGDVSVIADPPAPLANLYPLDMDDVVKTLVAATHGIGLEDLSGAEYIADAYRALRERMTLR